MSESANWKVHSHGSIFHPIWLRILKLSVEKWLWHQTHLPGMSWKITKNGMDNCIMSMHLKPMQSWLKFCLVHVIKEKGNWVEYLIWYLCCNIYSLLRMMYLNFLYLFSFCQNLKININMTLILSLVSGNVCRRYVQ